MWATIEHQVETADELFETAGKLPTNRLSVFDHFVGFALKVLKGSKYFWGSFVRPKKVVLFLEIDRVKNLLALTHPQSRMCIRIYISDLNNNDNNNNKKDEKQKKLKKKRKYLWKIQWDTVILFAKLLCVLLS